MQALRGALTDSPDSAKWLHLRASVALELHIDLGSLRYCNRAGSALGLGNTALALGTFPEMPSPSSVETSRDTTLDATVSVRQTMGVI